jgi:hypothetical protein
MRFPRAPPRPAARLDPSTSPRPLRRAQASSSASRSNGGRGAVRSDDGRRRRRASTHCCGLQLRRRPTGRPAVRRGTGVDAGRSGQEIPGSSSTLTLTSLIRPRRRMSTSFEGRGDQLRHGPHHAPTGRRRPGGVSARRRRRVPSHASAIQGESCLQLAHRGLPGALQEPGSSSALRALQIRRSAPRSRSRHAESSPTCERTRGGKELVGVCRAMVMIAAGGSRRGRRGGAARR